MVDSNTFRILVVDDDKDILELLKYNLEKEGFTVRTLDERLKAISVARNFSPDLIILDIMMPNLNGMEICSSLRALARFEKTYIFFLTAQSEHFSQLTALGAGADDYIEKVMGIRSLIYKVNSVLKMQLIIRKGIPAVVAGDLTLDRRSTSVKFQGKEIKLCSPEFDLLFFFAQNANREMSIQNIIHSIWGPEIYVSDGSVEMYIQNLRRKISPDIIESYRTDCYRFIAP
jgi:two-component system alkaline phosphatase synthesis response regulator PhoP